MDSERCLTMQAVVLHGPNDLAVERVPMPELRHDEVLLSVAACGICGSDLRYLVGENPWAKHTLGHQEPNPPDMILGHELAGVVELHGRRRRVGVLSFRTCGACLYCRTGRSNLCPNTQHLGHGAGWVGSNPGGMAEFCPVWSNHLFDLPNHVSFEEATFLDGLGVAVHAVRSAGVFPGCDVLVLGGGPIGLSIGQVAAAMGAGRVALTDVYDTPLDCGAALGMAPCLNVAGADSQDVAGALLDTGVNDGFTAVFDTTGQLEAQYLGLSVLQRGGTFVAMAGVVDGLQLNESSLAGERRLVTSSNNFVEDFEIGLRLLVSGAVRVAPMITHSYPLEEAAAAFDTALRKQETGALKVVLCI